MSVQGGIWFRLVGSREHISNHKVGLLWYAWRQKGAACLTGVEERHRGWLNNEYTCSREEWIKGILGMQHRLLEVPCESGNTDVSKVRVRWGSERKYWSRTVWLRWWGLTMPCYNIWDQPSGQEERKQNNMHLILVYVRCFRATYTHTHTNTLTLALSLMRHSKWMVKGLIASKWSDGTGLWPVPSDAKICFDLTRLPGVNGSFEARLWMDHISLVFSNTSKIGEGGPLSGTAGVWVTSSGYPRQRQQNLFLRQAVRRQRQFWFEILSKPPSDFTIKECSVVWSCCAHGASVT